MRKVILANSEIYHIFNRGIESRPTFTDKREYFRAFTAMGFYRFENPPLRLAKILQVEKQRREEILSEMRQKGKELVKIISFCFMPNHFHFLLRQEVENGITKFLSNFANSYTRYFNTKNERLGPLFQGIFKAVRVETDEQLMHVSRYINLNPVVSLVIKKEELDTYPWSSFAEFIGEKNGFCYKEIVLNLFRSPSEYRKFVYDQIEYGKSLEKIKHLVLE